ncbi:MAG TPA: hypothetical protein VGE73_02400 [Pseudolabrys sp.]
MNDSNFSIPSMAGQAGHDGSQFDSLRRALTSRFKVNPRSRFVRIHRMDKDCGNQFW